MNEDRTQTLLELLIQVNREVAAALDLRTVLQRLLFAATQNVGGERGSIIVVDDSGKPIDATIIYGRTLREHTTQQLKETVDRGLAGWVIQHRKAVLVPDTSQDERWIRRADDAMDQSGAKSAICVPLLARERLVGVLTLVHSVPNVFDLGHLELMQAIADQASIAVLNARLYTETLRQARVMTALADGAAAFSASLDVREVWQRVLNQTMQALQVETVAIGLIEGPERSIVFRAATGQNAGNILDRRIPGGQGLAGQVARDGRGLVISNVNEDKRYTDLDRFSGIGTRALAVAPIQSQGITMGVLEAINPISSGGFDADALTVMTGIGSLAGTTIRNAQLFEQLQNAHQRYRELFEESIHPIFITGWDGKILEANREAVRLSDIPADDLRQMNIDRLHEINWKVTGIEFENLRAGDESIYESVLHKAEAGGVPVEVHARRVQFEDADSIQWTLRDITERKELDSLREDLTAMIYHDLRSPLANIVSSLDVLGSMIGQDEAIRSVLRIAVHSTERIQRLVNSLLDINRLESGQTIATQKAVDPKELIELAVKDISPAVANRHQKLEVDIPEDLPNVWVDIDMMRRVMINLIENAIKFSLTEDMIEVGAKVDGANVRIWVKDNGPGIPANAHDRIFEKFARLKGKDKPGGLGIGLAFCRLAVQAHGGKIWVESEEGKGSKFIFVLPVMQEKVTRN
ncbi:MAG TPA: GAF domain-containing protein [Anaerolineales bacterium]|nr:GAF domain-containing protein [Anaerolineales bacterium]